MSMAGAGGCCGLSNVSINCKESDDGSTLKTVPEIADPGCYTCERPHKSSDCPNRAGSTVVPSNSYPKSGSSAAPGTIPAPDF